MIQLPDKFIQQMNVMLGREADAFLASFQESKTQGLRFNSLKGEMESDLRRQLFGQWKLEPVPWCSEGYYYADEARPGKHPLHAAGVYYIQEPSAMSAVALLDPQPGNIVLDLAAAPGGKSTQIAAWLDGRGLLVANEIHPARAKILSENIERMGVRNAVVTQETPDRLAQRFPQFFDAVLLDAPCSGEGMFRKDPEAVAEWSPRQVEACAARQAGILPAAVGMLKPGGRMAYSTCTFNREENEDRIEELLDSCPDMELVRIERIWPHLQRGEGHFVALLRKRESQAPETAEAAGMARRADRPKKGASRQKKPPKEGQDAMRLFEDFAADRLPGFRLPAGEPLLFGERLFWLPQAAGCPFGPVWLEGLRTLRPGLHLADLKKNRIEPAHALALAVPAADAASVHRLSSSSADALAFLRGEALPAGPEASGWTLVSVDGYPLGWGKAAAGQLKNHLPKGLRWPG